VAAGAASGVDIHVHLTRFWRDLATTAYTPDIDYTVAGLLREFDAAGIGEGIAIPLHFPSTDEMVREEEELVRASGGRLRPVATANPTEGAESVARSIEAWDRVAGLAAVKLFPGYQHFYPHDRRLAPFYEWVHRRDLPVLIHQGDTLERDGLVKFARPVEVDEVAVQYRDLRFVLCHLGNPWIEEAAEVVYKNENVYADTSGLLASPRVPYFDRMLERARQLVEGAIVTVGSPDRFLYGSDWPLESIETAVALIQGLKLPEEDRTAILGGNARRLFRLAERPRPAPKSRRR
jgi:uncharacterized protein